MDKDIKNPSSDTKAFGIDRDDFIENLSFNQVERDSLVFLLKANGLYDKEPKGDNQPYDPSNKGCSIENPFVISDISEPYTKVERKLFYFLNLGLLRRDMEWYLEEKEIEDHDGRIIDSFTFRVRILPLELYDTTPRPFATERYYFDITAVYKKETSVVLDIDRIVDCIVRVNFNVWVNEARLGLKNAILDNGLNLLQNVNRYLEYNPSNKGCSKENPFFIGVSNINLYEKVEYTLMEYLMCYMPFRWKEYAIKESLEKGVDNKALRCFTVSVRNTEDMVSSDTEERANRREIIKEQYWFDETNGDQALMRRLSRRIL